ncbi:hypothetical protein GCM10009808_12680 [Microbacterium sediminicola]|uniref:DUF559 domain-containing protein n=1 Tax=Microbacterium sediminicola TaxID=415210 RepID=A0ABN2I0S7_9MICO
MRPVSDLVAMVDAVGAAHTRTLRRAGFTEHAVRVALAGGRVERVRRSWIVSRECPDDLRRAASAGGRVTCLTAARRLSLWTPDHTHIHLAVAPTASRNRGGDVKLHWSVGPSPVADGRLVDPLVNVLHNVSTCVPLPDAAAVWESAIRKKLVATEMLERVDWPSVPGRELAASVSALSDSGIETRFVHLMSTLKVAVSQQVWIDGHPVDALIGARLVVQLDGFAHHQAAERRRDIAADARLVLMGYTVLRFDYAQVLFDPAHVVDTVSGAIAQGLHRARAVSPR